MEMPARESVIRWVALILPTATLFVVGCAYWWLENFKGPDPGYVTPFVLPACVGAIVGWGSGRLVRLVFKDDAEQEEIHLFVSILATFALVFTFCLWWGDWVVQLAVWLEGSPRT